MTWTVRPWIWILSGKFIRYNSYGYNVLSSRTLCAKQIGENSVFQCYHALQIEVFNLQSKIKLKDATIAYLEAELQGEREKQAKAAHGEECDCHRELKQSVGQLKQYAEQLRRGMEEKEETIENQNTVMKKLTHEVSKYKEKCDNYREERSVMQVELNRVGELYISQNAALRRKSDSLSSELEESRKRVDLLHEQLDMRQCEATRYRERGAPSVYL